FFIDRNDKLSARDVFAPFKPRFSQYQAGVTVSGPIKKEKAFFFASFERLSIKQNNFVTISDLAVGAIARQGFPISNGPQPFGVGNTFAVLRTDFQLTSNDSLWVRYNFGGAYDGKFEPFGGLTAASSASVFKTDDNNIALSNTFISAPLNLINETR